jgi:poly(3-hydroxybutyrate) depolymerase
MTCAFDRQPRPAWHRPRRLDGYRSIAGPGPTHCGLAKSSALVVALHGGQQTARGFDLATGWSALGRKHGFAVMFPEQKSANNSQNCFNWFIERHVSSNDGEIASIRAMAEKMLRDHNLDRSRVFVTGLSAGGAMACALLASYPDLFAAESSRASRMERGTQEYIPRLPGFNSSQIPRSPPSLRFAPDSCAPGANRCGEANGQVSIALSQDQAV